VKTNGQPSETVLRITGFIIPDPTQLRKHIGKLQVNRGEFNFANVYDTERARDSILVGNFGQEPIELVFEGLEEFSEIFDLEMEDNELTPEETDFIYCTLKPGKTGDYGFNRHSVRFYDKNDPVGTQGNLQITYHKNEDFRAWSYEQKANAPNIKYQNTTCDFGTKKQNELVECKFIYSNTGSSDLIIRDVRSASFVSVKSLDKVVAPGEEGELILEVDLTRSTGSFIRYITVTTNCPTRVKNKLTLRGKVIDR
jgi:hypothetical protein